MLDLLGTDQQGVYWTASARDVFWETVDTAGYNGQEK